ncbi:zinc finger protein basonuclin-2 [Silurus meridionalis]|uniref:zinc finger protein basonuclin-2 n=1 Tax=Silurus meridionalis TaxID=175797 RepID=UPI001EECDDB9|nr:zinc finger protein basonuclin-2 [Silurus meridionalis]
MDTHRTHTLHQQVLMCSHQNCSCECFLPERLDLRSCNRCKHGWVTHALSKLRVCSDQVEVVHSGVVCDLSALMLFHTHAFPVRMKILLDRLFSVLTHQHVLNILHTHCWTLSDYIRGYKLQDSSGKVLDHWVIMAPEDEFQMLHQFLRFGETRSSAELMLSQLSASISKPGRDHHLYITEHHLLTNGIIRGQGSPGLSHVVNFSGDMQKCRETSPSNLHTIQSQFYHLQRDRESRRGETAEPEAGDEKKHRGARDRRSCVFSVRKSRVSCFVCGKTFYDRGTLKIHHNAVHLKIKHRCTVEGCDMLFSSLRSRNRHSANPNPRLHNTHHTHATHSNASPWASLRTPMSPVQDVKISSTAMLAPATTSSVYASVNMNNYTEMIDQHQMPIHGLDSAWGGASTQFWTNQSECKGVIGAPARKKSRKSTKPMKFKMETCDDHKQLASHKHQ